MSDISSVSNEAGIGVLTIDSPPVNALGAATRQAVYEGIAALLNEDQVEAIVLICAGRTFFAGADISEFDRPVEQPDLDAVAELIENAAKPVIAAMHGTALGGGYETALACHFRIAVPSAKLGLPEVNLGLLPGAGGTQRLPRLIGAEKALEIIAFGKPLGAREALSLGMIDALAGEGALREDAIAFARRVLDQGLGRPRVRDKSEHIAADRGNASLYANFLAQNARVFRGYKAPFAIARAVEAAVESPDFATGLACEKALFEEIVETVESRALRHVFFAERETAKILGLSAATPVSDIGSVGVIGAGTMGGGIAMNFLNIGIPVTLVETSQEALDRGVSVIRRNYEATARKGRMTQEQVDRRVALLKPALGLSSLATVDLVIEAVFEEMGVKKDIFGQLDTICGAGTILASNTSFLDLNAIASATTHPERVVGLHFFSPANVMRLLEVVRGANTSDPVIATAMKLAKKIGKVPVLSGVCHGFIANRIMRPYMQQSDELVLEGPTPPQIDQAVVDYGFAMGPFQMIDLVGLDVIGRGSDERTLSGDLVKRDRLGQKQNGGFYDYDAQRKATYSPVAAQVIADLAKARGVGNAGSLPKEAIVARLLYPVVNEGAKVLEEGIALRASDVDVAAILGYNWPAYTGGPMFWADTTGLPGIVAGLRAMGIEPARLLAEKAAAGASFTR